MTADPAAGGARDVRARIHYLADDGTRPQIHVDSPGPGDLARTARYVEHGVTVRDARRALGPFGLDEAGFAFRRWPTDVADFDDDTAVRAGLYPEIEALMRDETGAARVLIFDHTVRSSDGSADGGRRAVAIAHNDYSERSGPQRAADVVAAQAPGTPLPARFAIVNAWRPVAAPVERDPLAVLDARTVGGADLRPVDIVYAERTGEILEAVHRDAHRWYWLPWMGLDEVLLFKQFDSRDDGRARFTPHSAFEDPETRPDAPPRHSIELRVLLLFAD